jgi:hypothetical protein
VHVEVGEGGGGGGLGRGHKGVSKDRKTQKALACASVARLGYSYRLYIDYRLSPFSVICYIDTWYLYLYRIPALFAIFSSQPI